MASQIAIMRLDAIMIDTSKCPERALREPSNVARRRNISLQRADAQTMLKTVTTALSA